MIIKSLPVPIKIQKTNFLNGGMTQLTIISPLKAFVVFVNLKPCISVVNVILDAHETVNVNSLMNSLMNYCRYISELESLKQEKLKHYSKDYSVTDKRHSLPNFEMS